MAYLKMCHINIQIKVDDYHNNMNPDNFENGLKQKFPQFMAGSEM